MKYIMLTVIVSLLASACSSMGNYKIKKSK